MGLHATTIGDASKGACLMIADDVRERVIALRKATGLGLRHAHDLVKYMAAIDDYPAKTLLALASSHEEEAMYHMITAARLRARAITARALTDEEYAAEEREAVIRLREGLTASKTERDKKL